LLFFLGGVGGTTTEQLFETPKQVNVVESLALADSRVTGASRDVARRLVLDHRACWSSPTTITGRQDKLTSAGEICFSRAYSTAGLGNPREACKRAFPAERSFGQETSLSKVGHQVSPSQSHSHRSESLPALEAPFWQ
jgi:hypothetical protein